VDIGSDPDHSDLVWGHTYFARRYKDSKAHAAANYWDWPLRQHWMRCPNAEHLHIVDFPKDHAMIAGWIAYSGKYVRKLRRLGIEDDLWKVFGRG
jgi:hypothetical protein